jgi:hypothetical protein
MKGDDKAMTFQHGTPHIPTFSTIRSVSFTIDGDFLLDDMLDRSSSNHPPHDLQPLFALVVMSIAIRPIPNRVTVTLGIDGVTVLRFLVYVNTSVITLCTYKIEILAQLR